MKIIIDNGFVIVDGIYYEQTYTIPRVCATCVRDCVSTGACLFNGKYTNWFVRPSLKGKM